MTPQITAPDKILHLATLAQECSRKFDYWKSQGCLHMAAYFNEEAQRYIRQAERIVAKAGL